MAKLTIYRGLPASGKSTAAKEQVVTEGNTVRLNRDLLRTMLHCDIWTGKKEGHTKDAQRKLADWFLVNDVNVIIDDTNLNPNTVQSWVDFAKIHQAKIEYKDFFDVSVKMCVDRDAMREKQVGEHVIKKMALEFLTGGRDPYTGKESDAFKYLHGKKVIICDIDGTIADCTHRLQYAKGETKNWDKFFDLVINDKPRVDIIRKVSELANAKDARVIFVSARPEKTRVWTQQWFREHVNHWFGDGKDANGTRIETLIMRENNDKRPDTEVKSDIYARYLKNLDIVRVFDDRPSVIRMWQASGLQVEDCGSGVEF